MPTVDIHDNNAFESAVRKFKRACEKAGIPTRLRQLEFYEKPTSKRKREKAAAAKRIAKKRREDAVPKERRGR